MMRSVMAAVVMAAAVGCGGEAVPDAGPKALAVGDSCFGGATCSGVKSALFCDNSKLAAYECPGGCTSNTSETVCNFAGAAAGSPCPARYWGTGVCEVKAMIVCSSTPDARGTWSRSACDGGCVVGASTIDCRP